MTEYAYLICGIVLGLLPLLLLWLLRRSLFVLLMGDSRISRVLHFFLLAVFGASLQVPHYESFGHTLLLLHFLLFFLLLFYAGQFAVITNNIEDLETDRLTNVERPLVKQAIPKELYLRIGIFCLLFALGLSLFAGLAAFCAISAISLVYYLYSNPPFKLKRFVFLAKFLIGLNSLFAALYGFTVAGGRLEDFPLAWALFILVPISLMANFVDLKDTEGDRIAGVKTLPVLLGNRKATYVIAFSTLLTYFWAALLLHSFYLSFCIALVCALHIALLFRAPYSEKPLFVLHNSLFVGLIVLILILK